MPARPTLLHRLPRLCPLHIPHHHYHHLPPALKPPRISTTEIGTNYERLALLALTPLAFDLRQVGGRADKGVDLIGRWRLPSCLPSSCVEDGGRNGAAEPPKIKENGRLEIPVIAQCKGHKTTPHPAWVRELEGTLAAAQGGWSEGVGVLVSKGKATPGVREAVMGAMRGMVWVQMMVEEEGGGGQEGGVKGRGRIGQVLWNKRVGELVGEGVGVGFVYSPSGGGRVGRKLRLTYEGKVWEPELERGL